MRQRGSKYQHISIFFVPAFVLWLACGMDAYGAGRKMHFAYHSGIDSLEADSMQVDTMPRKKYRYIDVSLDYGSNFTYRRQIDETPTQSPYIVPSLFFHDKSGAWLSLSAYRMLNPYNDVLVNGHDTSYAPDWIEGDINVGWDYKIGKNNDLSFSYLLSKYNRDYPLVHEALAHNLEAYYGHDFDLFYTALRFDFAFQDFTGRIGGKQQDINIRDVYGDFELSRDFYFDDVFFADDEFAISPMFMMVAGTNNFIGTVIATRFPKSAKAAEYAKNAGKFLIQQFSFSLPVAYSVGNFTFTPEADYTILTQKKTETSPTSYPIYRFSVAYRLNFKK